MDSGLRRNDVFWSFARGSRASFILRFTVCHLDVGEIFMLYAEYAGDIRAADKAMREIVNGEDQRG